MINIQNPLITMSRIEYLYREIFFIFYEIYHKKYLNVCFVHFLLFK